ncbi:Delta(14)-sterol reductase [Clonorchis sinensis]|uniref:Delta(14)-sterol reductase n=1 Tax=Clonorchis sinensis TaxID=79923 RepID=A0A3R7GUG2_CLOSI|nr:Delta(14)-sterol reductase [Clonorchis sinensis]
MPTKKTGKAKPQSVATRQRSKSAGRATPKPRSRTPSRSRSRSRVTAVAKRSRTPASESKARRRRSPSSSSSSSDSSPRPVIARGRVPHTSGNNRSRPSAIREATPTRVSQRIIHRVDTTRQQSASVRSPSPAVRTPKPGFSVSLYQRISTVIDEKVFPRSFRALLSVVTYLPLFYWLNLWVFTSASSQGSSADAKAPYTLWGPAYRFAGVLWPVDWRVYFDYRCHAFVLFYLFLHFLVARFIPFGNRWNNNTEARRAGYKANGLVALVLFGAIYAVAQFLQLPRLSSVKPSMMIPKYWLGLLAAMGNIATVAACVVLAASRRLPRSQCSSEGNTGNLVVDFWFGRPLRPRWFGLDWKMVVQRPAIIGLLLAEATYLCAQWERYGRISPALAVLVVLHFIWLVDAVAVEHTFATSFEVLHLGLGYRSLGGALLFPFLYALPAAYLSTKPDVGRFFTPTGDPVYYHWIVAACAVVIFFVGYWIYRSSNSQKNLFRNQPNHPSFADLSKISGPHTQRLLAGGWWGVSRHPNYLGDLLMAYAASLPSGFSSAIPWIYPLILTIFLLSRIHQTERFNEDKHGISWTMYKKLVPYKLVPRIF